TAARSTPIAPMAAVAPAPKPPAPPPAAAAPAASAQARPEESQPPADAVPESLEIEGGDLPADAPMEGLEPIAAHSQGEMNVDGGDGIAPPAGDAAVSDEPVPLEDQSALQGWAEGSPEGVPLETPAGATGWGEPAGPAVGGAGTDELPIDAIMGTADVLEHPDASSPALDAPDAWSDISDPLAAQTEAAPAGPGDATAAAEPEHSQSESAEQPDTAGSDSDWEAAAADIEAAANESRDSGELDAAAAVAAEEAAPDAASETGRGEYAEPSIGDAASDEQPSTAAAGDSFLESPDDAPATVDEVAIDAAGWSDESGEYAASPVQREEAEFSMSSPAEEPPSPADAEASFDVDTQDAGELDGHGDEQMIAATQRQGWLLRQSDRDRSDDDTAQLDEQESYGPGAGDEQESYGSAAGEPAAYEPGAAAEQASYASETGDDQASYGSETGDEQASYDQPDASSQPAEQGDSLELATDQGWSETPSEETQEAWYGDALSSTTSLSPADLGTLAALGLDPADGAAAQRMLACLVRVLNRRQAIDLDELAAEIRQSQTASESAAQPQGDDLPAASEPDAPAPAGDEPAQTSGTDEDPWTGSHDS
ncbi:MAG TPA: hypothetical protein VG496_15155, partial [Myxococcales bacterium]|nr:hypothetical protein [Myxococcales bacterium]